MTTGSYNDGKRGFKGWDKNQEKELLGYMAQRDSFGNKVMLSYIIENNEESNSQVMLWLEENPHFRLIPLKMSGSWSGKKRKEVLIINYEK